MLIVFKSKAAGDVMMFGDVAMTLMEIMGKAPGEKGIVTVEQLPAAVRDARVFGRPDDWKLAFPLKQQFYDEPLES